MKNILNEKPSDKFNPRQDFSVRFVNDADINKKKVLDIGCGFGWFEKNALKRGVGEISAIEITEEDLISIKTLKDKRIIIKVAGALKLPFKDNYFDTVVAWEVIEHIPKDTEEKMFKEINRVLKKNGVLYLSTPYASFFSKYSDPAWWIVKHRHYSLKQLMNYGIRVNFNISEYHIRGRWVNLISLLNLYFSKWILRRKPIFENKLDVLGRNEYENKSGFINIFMKYIKVNNYIK